MYLLDSNVFSESTRPVPDPRVGQWMRAQTAANLFTSGLVIGELWRGAVRMPGKRGADLLEWVEREVLQSFKGRILPFTSTTGQVWGEMITRTEKSGRPRPYLDSLIAATALEHGLTLVSRNTADFEGLGVPLFNPWQA